ncbi:MAG: hypothetical protein WA323_15655, partial [Candidatus Nitrosopolaris sp.]
CYYKGTSWGKKVHILSASQAAQEPLDLLCRLFYLLAKMMSPPNRQTYNKFSQWKINKFLRC